MDYPTCRNSSQLSCRNLSRKKEDILVRRHILHTIIKIFRAGL